MKRLWTTARSTSNNLDSCFLGLSLRTGSLLTHAVFFIYSCYAIVSAIIMASYEKDFGFAFVMTVLIQLVTLLTSSIGIVGIFTNSVDLCIVGCVGYKVTFISVLVSYAMMLTGWVLDATGMSNPSRNKWKPNRAETIDIVVESLYAILLALSGNYFYSILRSHVEKLYLSKLSKAGETVE